MVEPRLSLRERKKLDAKRQIVHVANKLFRKHGYDAVTLEQIADACVMSVRTILRYFSTKEALALAGEHALVEQFTARLHERNTDAVTCWREFYAETVQLMDTPVARKRMMSILSTSPLLAEFLRISQTYQDVLAAAIFEELDDAPPLETEVFASVLVSSSEAVFRRWLRSDEPFDMDALEGIVDRVCDAFDHRRQRHGAQARRGRKAVAG